LGYGTYKLAQGRLVASAEGEWPLLAQDFYFIHPANPLFTGKGN
jgi:hypothetical protein